MGNWYTRSLSFVIKDELVHGIAALSAVLAREANPEPAIRTQSPHNSPIALGPDLAAGGNSVLGWQVREVRTQLHAQSFLLGAER
jgi:hypothetical protein